MKWIIVVLLLASTPAYAQSTFVLTDTSKLEWVPSPDNATVFGTPPVAVVSGYTAELYLKAAVVGGVPSGVPAITLDLGKPPVVGGVQVSAPLKPLVQGNTEYVAFAIAKGPGGVSARSGPTVPFGYPAAPRPVPSAVTLTP